MSDEIRKEPLRASPAEPGEGSGVDRRSFLRQTGTAAIGLAGLGLARDAEAAPPISPAPAIKAHRTLGKTGLVVSDIGFGSGGCRSADLVRYCYDRGVNYFDTAEMYRSEGWTKGEYVEALIGEALQGKRDKVVITTKFMARADHDRNRMMAELEASLRRLRTDYVDIYLNHAVNTIARLQNPEWPEFVALAKKQGKIRFSGMSGHGGYLKRCLDYALDHDLADVILASHNFGTDPAFYERFTKHFDMVANQKGISRLFRKAHEKGVGVIVMKTQMGAKVNDLSPYGRERVGFERAAFRWVFSDPHIDAAIVSMKNRRLADRYLRCSGDHALQSGDAEILERYVRDTSREYCRNACGACRGSCPHGVSIPDVLRQRMYERSYGNPRMARTGYRALERDASACLGCAAPTCAASCPFGLDIPSLARESARLLG